MDNFKTFFMNGNYGNPFALKAAFALKFLANGIGYTDQENKTKHGNSKSIF